MGTMGIEAIYSIVVTAKLAVLKKKKELTKENMMKQYGKHYLLYGTLLTKFALKG